MNDRGKFRQLPKYPRSRRPARATRGGGGGGKGLPEGTRPANAPGRRAGQRAPSALDRARRTAQKEKDAKFTALLHHVEVDRLRAAYFAFRWTGAPSVDGVTHEYEQDLEKNPWDLHR